jgi:NTE family protein
VFSGSVVAGRRPPCAAARHLHGRGPLRRLLAQHLPVERIEDLAVPFQCVAASIERAAEHWFTEGPLGDAVMASCAVRAAAPGPHRRRALPGRRLGEQRAGEPGRSSSAPRTVFVLQVGRVERPLTPPKLPWQVALWPSRCAPAPLRRRHGDAADDVVGARAAHRRRRPEGLKQLRYRDTRRTRSGSSGRTRPAPPTSPGSTT